MHDFIQAASEFYILHEKMSHLNPEEKFFYKFKNKNLMLESFEEICDSLSNSPKVHINFYFIYLNFFFFIINRKNISR